MYTYGKKSKIVSLFGRCLRMLLIFGTIAICIQACSKDDENKEEAPPKETPSGDGLLNSEQDTIIASQEFLSKV